jgi:uncharacterized protein (TIGR02145 family)
MVWLAQNLDYPVDGSIKSAGQGRLYTCEAAKNACPKGGRLPTTEEWRELVNFAGGKDSAGKKLKSRDGWFNGKNGTDEYGFSAIPCDGRSYEGYVFGNGHKGVACWWSATEISAKDAWTYAVYWEDGKVGTVDYMKNSMLSVRCAQDN